MARKKSSKLRDTLSIQGRSEDAVEYEIERFEVTKEIERLMKQYGKMIGRKDLGKRKHGKKVVPLGKGDNDIIVAELFLKD
jgi:hypothetical protein